MSVFDKFILVSLSKKIKDLAVYHANQRTSEIVRQFVPSNAPLVHLESNYVGALGEIAVKKYLGFEVELDDNYKNHQIDDGDIKYGALVYDVKTDAIPLKFYKKLYDGSIRNYDKYGCRVFTAKHLHHLKKYTGGLIFCAFEIPDDAKATKKDGQIRDQILEKDEILIIGYVTQENVAKNPPTWYTPPDPTGKSSKYNSSNYIFHHDDLLSLKRLKNA